MSEQDKQATPPEQEREQWPPKRPPHVCHCAMSHCSTDTREAALREVVEAAKKAVEITSRPGMVDPFNNGWKWRYKLEDALSRLEKETKP